jgi:hypothetical protein
MELLVELGLQAELRVEQVALVVQEISQALPFSMVQVVAVVLGIPQVVQVEQQVAALAVGQEQLEPPVQQIQDLVAVAEEMVVPMVEQEGQESSSLDGFQFRSLQRHPMQQVLLVAPLHSQQQ